MAESKRRGDDAVDDRLDEAFDDDAALDDDLADDELDDDFDDDLDDEDEDEPVVAGRRGRGGASLTKSKDRSDARPRTRGGFLRPSDKRPTKSKSGDRRNIFSRFVNFVREVVAELRKVIWPTRNELLTYTGVVVVFVTIMIVIVGGLDWLFAQAVVWVFGNGTTAAK
jgi:preprotein translocase subunit SecE